MRILIMVVGLLAGIAAGAQAGDHPAAVAEHPVAVVKQATGALAVVDELKSSGLVQEEDAAFVSTQIQGLLDKGMPLGDAKKLIADSLTQAKVEGLEGDEMKARIGEVTGAAMGQLEGVESGAEHPAAIVEHPATGKPKDHPAH
jgi:hypothetical protein